MFEGLININWNEIINTLLNGLYYILDFLFSWINIPQVPETIINSINTFLDLIFDNLSLLGFFVRPITLKILVPLIIFAVNFKYIYKIVMWFLHKLPFLDIK